MYEDVIEKVLISEDELKSKIRGLGRQIRKDYAGKTPLMVGILKGSVLFFADLIREIEGKDVIIVEDIVDSGYTMKYLTGVLSARNPASVRICTLLDKPSRRETDVQVDYKGFEVGNEFVVGYGLDYAGLYRNIPYIGILKRSVYGG